MKYGGFYLFVCLLEVFDEGCFRIFRKKVCVLLVLLNLLMLFRVLVLMIR